MKGWDGMGWHGIIMSRCGEGEMRCLGEWKRQNVVIMGSVNMEGAIHSSGMRGFLPSATVLRPPVT